MNFYSTAFLAATFAVFVILLAISTALREHRLRASLHSEHIKFKDGEMKYTFWTRYSFCWIILCASNLLTNMEAALRQRELLFYMPDNYFANLLEYEKYNGYMTRYDGKVRFYLVMLIIYLIFFIWTFILKDRYSETYFTEKGILRGGSFYKCENIAYGFDNYIILIYNRKGKLILEITTADSGELDAAREFLGKYYTRKNIVQTDKIDIVV